MKYSQLAKEILARIHWIILVTLTVAVICTIYFMQTQFMHESTVSFFVDDDEGQGLNFNGSDQNNLVLAKVANGNRLYHLTKSTEMVDYLVNKFNLYNHYKIDRNSPVHYETVTAVLLGNINIRLSEFNALSISVKDLDKDMTAKIANEIFYKLDEMNKDFIVSNVAKKIKIYDQLLSNNKKQSLEEAQGLGRLIDSCKYLMGNSSKIKNAGSMIADLGLNLTMLSNQLSSVNSDLLKTIKLYEISAASIQKENLPNLRLINQALPDLKSSFYTALRSTLVLSLVAAVLTFCIIGILCENELRTMVKTKQSLQI